MTKHLRIRMFKNTSFRTTASNKRDLAVKGLRVLNNQRESGATDKINPYSAGIDFRRQNLTSVDVRFWRLKSTPAL